MTGLPCPAWCVTDHSQEDIDDLTAHMGADIRVPVMAYGGGDSPDQAVSVSLTAVDNANGSRGPVGVWLEAGGEELSPENAVTFAVAILNAAAAATGGRLDRLVSAELDRLCNGGEAA